MRVYRQSVRNRLVHWGIAVSCFGLIMTGILQMPVAKRYGLTQVFPSTADFFSTLPWHYAFAILFTFLCVFHLMVHALEGDFDIVPQRGDLSKSVVIIKALLTGGPEPPSGKYLPEQRLAWAAFAAVFALLIITGLLKTLKNLSGIDFPDPMLFGLPNCTIWVWCSPFCFLSAIWRRSCLKPIAFYCRRCLAVMLTPTIPNTDTVYGKNTRNNPLYR